MTKKKVQPSKRTTGRKAARERVEFKGYLNRNISADEKVTYRSDLEAGWRWDEKAEELISDGLNLKWSWDSYNEAFAATLYDTNADSDHAGYCLSFRGPEPFEAMSRLVWVHTVLLEGNWNNISEVGDSDEW